MKKGAIFMLKAKILGYKEYSEKARDRLIPFVW